MAAFLSSVFGAGAQFFDNQGRVLAGGKLYTLVAGSSGLTNLQATWTDSTQGTQNSNPIIMDATGRPTSNGSTPTEIWLGAGLTYKFVLTDSSGNTIGTWDNISGVNDLTATASEWVATGLTPTYISATQFSVAGNQTTVFTADRRVQFLAAGGTGYGFVTAASFAGGITTVTLANDSISLDAGLSAVSTGFLNATNPSVPQQFPPMIGPVSVASAATTPIGAASSATVTVTGVVGITAFDTVPSGIMKWVKFAGSLTLTNSANLLLPGAANITTTANDTALFRSLGAGNWECVAWYGNQGSNFPSDTRIGFQQTAVPTGWTKDTTAALNDSAMRIVTGTASSGGTQGLSAFTSTAGYTLQVADIPSHSHTVTYWTGTSGAQAPTAGTNGNVGPFPGSVSGNTGGGGSHSHPVTAIKYYDFSIGVKN